MIGAVEGDEAFRVLRRLIDQSGILDSDGLVLDGVEDQQGAAQAMERLLGRVVLQIVIFKKVSLIN